MNTPPVVSSNEAQRSWGLLPTITALIVGIASGSAAGVGLFVYFDEITPTLGNIIQLLIPILGVFAIISALLIPISTLVIRRFVGNAEGTLDKVVWNSSRAFGAILERDLGLANRHMEKALLAGVSWYTQAAVKKWAVNTSLSLLVAMVGLIGTVLLYKQIALLKDQNDKISTQIEILKVQNEKLDQQIIVSEAARRGSLTSELLSILQQINSANLSNSSKTERTTVSDALKSKIIAFSRAASPYYVLDAGEYGNAIILNEVINVRQPKYNLRKISPERGQLLLGLIAEKVAVPELANFDYADLRGASLSDCNLDSARMSNADFSFANISNCSMRGINISASRVYVTTFSNVNLDQAKAIGINFKLADFDNTTMRGSVIYKSKFNDVDISSLDLTNSIISLPNKNDNAEIASGYLPKSWKLEPTKDYYVLKPIEQ